MIGSLLSQRNSNWTVPLILLAAMMAGCAPGSYSRPLTFQSIGRGNSFTAEIEQPALYVLESQDDASSLSLDSFDPLVADSILNADYETHWVVVAYYGQTGSDGYGIEVQSVNINSDRIQVIVQLSRPAPDVMSSDVISYPYDVVLIEREDLADADVVWEMIDADGKIVAQTP